MKLINLIWSLSAALVLTAIEIPEAFPPADSIHFEVQGYQKPEQQLVEKCSQVIETWADTYSDDWYQHMKQCVYLDADYLVEQFPTERKKK